MRALITRALDGDTKAATWLLEHTAALDPEGTELRPIAPSIDRPAGQFTPVDNTPRVVIGVSLGADFARLSEQPPERLRPIDVDPE